MAGTVRILRRSAVLALLWGLIVQQPLSAASPQPTARPAAGTLRPAASSPRATPARAVLYRVGVKVFPPEAAVLVDGQTRQPTARGDMIRYFSLPAGNHLISLSLAGYLPRVAHVRVPDILHIEEKLERADGLLTLVAEVPTGSQPKSVQFSSDGRRLYIPLLNDTGLSVVDLGNFESRIVALGADNGRARGFVETAIHSGRRELWVSQMTTGQVHVLDEATLRAKAVYATGGRWSKIVQFASDGTQAWISNWISQTVTAIDVTSGALLKTVRIGGTPRGIVATPDGRYLYVTNYDTGHLERVNIALAKVDKIIKLGPGAARHVVFDAARSVIYLSDMAKGTVQAISLPDERVLATCTLAPCVNTIALSPDGRFLYASTRGRNNPETYLKKGPDFGRVFVVDTASMLVLEAIYGRNQPTGMAVSPDNRLIAFTDFLDRNVEIYSTENLYARYPQSHPVAGR